MREEINTVSVPLGDRSYDISVGYGAITACLGQLQTIAGASGVFIISDENVHRIYGKWFTELLLCADIKPLQTIIAPGEDSKSWDMAGKILETMLAGRLERKTPVIALGGGVVGDLAGFVAALYRRGTPFIQVPTTLLAQVDSSIGGKVAVNHPKGKNMFGTFYQPMAVWADLETLDTLQPAEWCAGLAEVAKYAMIKDADFFSFLTEHAKEILEKDRRFIPTVVKRCCEIKAEIVSQDERDEGLRNILNFGHTFGHALESATHYKVYRHGEAVSIGMAAVMELAVMLGLISESDRDRLIGLLTEWQLPVQFPANLTEEILQNLNYDKKVSGNKITFILPKAIGEVMMSSGLDPAMLKAALLKRTI